MSEQTTSELEREAESVRAQVADTAESIRRKLTAGQLFDEFTDMFTGGDLSGAVGNLKSQVRDNPLPVVLVGAGLAWLAFGRSPGSSHSTGSTHRPTTRPPGSTMPSGEGGSMRGKVSSFASSVADSASSVAGSVSDTASSAARSVSDTVGSVTDTLSDTADRLRQSMLTGSQHMPHMSRTISDWTTREPLLVAAAGVAVGALIGAMLPATELEKEQLGPRASRLREQASDVVDKGRESANRVASQAYDAVKEEADRQGLVPEDGSSMGEKLGKVVRSATEAGEGAVRDELGVDHDGRPRQT